jgi:hypothetical protein
MIGSLSTIGHDRTRGKYCYGKTPMQTSLDSVSLAQEKILDSLSTPALEPERSAGGDAAAERLLDQTTVSDQV